MGLLFFVWSFISHVAGDALDSWNLPSLDIEHAEAEAES